MAAVLTLLMVITLSLVVKHPVRRRIIMLLMRLGNEGMITISAYGEGAQLRDIEVRKNTSEGQAEHERSILRGRGPKETNERDTANETE